MWLTTNESAITERVDRFIETGHHERIWRDWNSGERTIRVLRDAVRDAPDGVTTLGEFHSAKELFEAVEAYEPEADWKRDVCNRISSPRSLGNLLASQRNHRNLTIRQHRNTNHYRIQESSCGVQPLDVESIEDLFELPCMANMAERLHEKKPVRKDLYKLRPDGDVATTVPGKRPRQTIVADLKDIFSRWSWYDEQVTDYQIRYEFSNTIGGDTPSR